MSKLKLIISFAVGELLLLIILRSLQSGGITALGVQAFNLGNRQVILKPANGFEVIFGEEKLKAKLGVSDGYLFALQKNEKPIRNIFADCFNVGEFDTYSKLMSSLEIDSTIMIEKKYIGSTYLSVVFQFKTDTSTHYYNRYINCFPYYLRIRTAWDDSRNPPKFIEDGLYCVEVTK